MNIRTLCLLTLGTTFALTSHAEGDALQSQSASLDSIATTEDLVTNFMIACAAQDEQRLREITTDDLRIEYALDTPGTYYGVDSLALSTECAALNGTTIELASVRVYPTADEQAIFVQYNTTGAIDFLENRQQLALVELHNKRIARIVNFSEPSNVIVTARERGNGRDRSAMALQDSGE
jgi:hypothetical protein